MRNTLCKTFGNCVLYSVFCFVLKLVDTLPLIINGSESKTTRTRYIRIYFSCGLFLYHANVFFCIYSDQRT